MINGFDTAIVRFFSELNTPGWLDGMVMFWTDYVQQILILAAIGCMFFKKTRKIGITAFLSMFLSVLFIEVFFKNIFDRIRPYDVYEWAKLIGDPSPTFSFPSGHTSAAFSAAMGFSYYMKKRWPKVLLFVAAAITGFTRIYISIHWTTDVLAGAINGILCGILAGLIVGKIYKWLESRKKAAADS